MSAGKKEIKKKLNGTKMSYTISLLPTCETKFGNLSVWFSFMVHQSLYVINAKSILNMTVLFQTIQFNISIVFFFFVYTQLIVKTVLFQTIQFSISTQFECQKQFHFKQLSLA